MTLILFFAVIGMLYSLFIGAAFGSGVTLALMRKQDQDDSFVPVDDLGLLGND